ncbi:MAG: flagellar assembly protein FliX [Devosia sp.]|uniref:flagellar assembly protein FliX n=1 Tax=Devosia sp. TaxID=1871048 RepID=UPI001AC69223|nr:flagellar assembly protein FliX [Devosia sp.]MBN9310379.1 flagellar assembly protein FliX [Devosia sp.]MBN9314731.1 flagellar assembly protein FliX [Devosia sp.]
MRIEGNTRITNVAGRSAPGASSGTFRVGQGGDAPESRPVAPSTPTTSIDALLALQAVEDPLARRRKLVRRGNQLVDALDGLRTDLLAGRLSDGRLNQLMAVVSQARERSEPGLDALIDDIELRARVELAKRGLFPA